MKETRCDCPIEPKRCSRSCEDLLDAAVTWVSTGLDARDWARRALRIQKRAGRSKDLADIRYEARGVIA
jgi:hypothetical protein